MPGMSGITFFNTIKEKYPDPLKMILTGYSDINEVIKAINEGHIFRYLTKPWNPVELDLAIEEAFNRYELVTNNKILLQKLKEVNSTLEKKVLERTKELEQANKNLKKINIEKNKYVGIVAHDLRNPIGNALSFSNLLISDYADFSKTEHIKYLQVINDRCSFALSLIESFLDTSKIESGILDLDLKEYNYPQFLESCISQNTLFAKKKSQEIFLDYQSSKKTLLFDKDKMEQVLTNLLSNAIKYSEPNKKIWVIVVSQGKQLQTQIRDEGQGIPKEELNTLFTAFKTTSVKATQNEKSTGLGLAIVKKIVEAHQGTIAVQSTPQIGSNFYFTLPVK
jgi:signal transduction histidine kinase